MGLELLDQVRRARIVSNKTQTRVYHKMTTICKHYVAVGEGLFEVNSCGKNGAIGTVNCGKLWREMAACAP